MAIHGFVIFMLRFESDLGESHCLSMFLFLIEYYSVNVSIFNQFLVFLCEKVIETIAVHENGYSNVLF